MKRHATWLFTLVLALGLAAPVAGQEGDPPARPDPDARARSKNQNRSDKNEAADKTDKNPDDNAAAAATVTPPGPMPLPEMPDPARILVVDLHEEVSLGMASFVDRVARALGKGDVLVLDINTFGGRVDAAVIIRDALLDLKIRGAKAVAYIHPRAISAGALISLATDVIVVAPGATIGAATPVHIGEGGKMESVDKKTVSYMRKEMRATAEARGRNGDIAEAMVDAEVEVPGLDSKDDLLTLDGTQAMNWGVASAEAATLDDLLGKLGYGEGAAVHQVEHVGWSWAEKVAAFLTSSVLSGLLMSIGMLGLLIGLYSGGHALPLALGGTCLGLFFFGHHVVNLAGFEEIILFVVGVGFLLYEIFVPGHVIPGVIGVVMVLGALVLGLVSFETVPFQVQWQEGFVLRALGLVFGSVAATAVFGIAAFQFLPATRLGRGLLLETAIAGKATDLQTDLHNQSMIGRSGKALSDLRPSGKVAIGTRRYDAVAERGYVAAGDAIEVRAVRGFSLVVQAARKPAAGTTPATPGQPDDATGETRNEIPEETT